MRRQSTRPGIRRVIQIIVVLLVGSCTSSRDSGPLSTTENACVIARERPSWHEATVEAARRWGTPPEVIYAIIWRESSFRADAQTPRVYTLGFIPSGRQSSAYGFSQAIDGTWDWYRRETGNGWADREDFADSVDFVGWYTNRTRRVNRVPGSDAYRQYLAYHEGHAGYARGSWQSKAGLQSAAAQVRDQAARYRAQLARCSV